MKTHNLWHISFCWFNWISYFIYTFILHLINQYQLITRLKFNIYLVPLMIDVLTKKKNFSNWKLFSEISNNCLNYTEWMYVKLFDRSCWRALLTKLKWTNTASVISHWGTLSPFFWFVIFFSLLSRNFIVSDVQDNILIVL